MDRDLKKVAGGGWMRKANKRKLWRVLGKAWPNSGLIKVDEVDDDDCSV